jgi:hypothetical protein
MINKGDLVRHVSEASFGVGIVTDIVASGDVPVARVSWQKGPLNIIYSPANLFTPEGLIIISEANSSTDDVINNENKNR